MNNFTLARLLATLVMKKPETLRDFLNEIPADDFKILADELEQLYEVLNNKREVIKASPLLANYFRENTFNEENFLIIWKEFTDAFKVGSNKQSISNILEYYSFYELILSSLALVTFTLLQGTYATKDEKSTPSSASVRPILDRRNLSNTSSFSIFKVNDDLSISSNLKDLVFQNIVNAIMNNQDQTDLEIEIPNQGDKNIKLLQKILWDKYHPLISGNNNSNSIYIRQHYEHWIIILKGDAEFMNQVLTQARAPAPTARNTARKPNILPLQPLVMSHDDSFSISPPPTPVFKAKGINFEYESDGSDGIIEDCFCNYDDDSSNIVALRKK